MNFKLIYYIFVVAELENVELKPKKKRGRKKRGMFHSIILISF